MTRQSRTVLRSFAALCVSGALLSGCGFTSVYDMPLPGGADVGDNPYDVTIEFEDVLDLVPQSAVMVNDVPVGRVTDIKVDDWNAMVTIRVNDEVELPDNARATIRQTSILGEKFVSLDAPEEPSSERLGDGDVIPLERSGRNPEIEEVLGALSLVLNGGGVAQLQTITQELNNALEGRAPEIKSVIRRLNRFMGEVDGSKAQIVLALEQIDELGDRAVEQKGSITQAVEELPAAIEILNDQRDEFVVMLESLDELSDVGTRVIRASGDETIANLKDLQPILDNLDQSGKSLVSSLRLLPTTPFPDALVGQTPEAAASYRGGDFMNGSLTFSPDFALMLEDMTPAERKAFISSMNPGGRSTAPLTEEELTDPPAANSEDGGDVATEPERLAELFTGGAS